MMITVYREAHFNAAHRLHQPLWTEEENKMIFGKCNNPLYHGHNYKLIVGVRGEIDPLSGYVIDMKILSKLIKEEVEEHFDHKNLNEELPEFKSLNPTVENIAVVIWNRLSSKLSPNLKLSIQLYETDRNYVQYTGN